MSKRKLALAALLLTIAAAATVLAVGTSSGTAKSTRSGTGGRIIGMSSRSSTPV